MQSLNRVKEFREAANWSVYYLSRKSGVSIPVIYILEAPQTLYNPDLHTCLALAKALKTPLGDLFFENEVDPNAPLLAPVPGGCSVYIFSDLLHKVIKIGISDSVSRRLKEVEAASGRNLTLSDVFHYANRELARAEESRLHNLLSDYRLPGEWFKLTYADLIRNHLH